MSDVNVTVKVDKRALDSIIRAFDGNVSQAIRTLAYSVEAKAKIKCPVDTGALRASIMTRSGTGYAGLVEAVGRSGTLRQELPAPSDTNTAYVGPTMEYGLYVELGTYRSRAQPYLVPAVRETESEIAQAFGNVVTGG